MKQYLAVLVAAMMTAGAVAQQVVQPSQPVETAGAVQPYDSEGRPNPDAFDWTGFALGLKIGTLGFGADATVYLDDWVNFRANGNLLPFEYTDTIDDIDFDLDMDFKSAMFLLDFYPFEGGNFRISAGVAFTDNELTLDATPDGSETIGDNEYTPEEIGTINGSVEFDPIAPYIGIGYGNAVLPDASLTFAVDFGVIFQTYDIEVSATGLASQDPTFQADLDELRSDIEDELNRLKIYPVISFGIAYHF
jgi:opacity protein-like surface antigen